MKKRYNILRNTGWLRHKTLKVCPPSNALNYLFFFSDSDDPRSDNEIKNKNQQSAIASANSPSWGKIKIGINVFVAYTPGFLWKGLWVD